MFTVPVRLFLIAGLALAALTPSAQAAPTTPSTAAFWTGADLSALPFWESRGVTYSQDGKAQDLLAIAGKSGWNVIRVRLWVNPDETDPKSRVSDLAAVSALGKRIKAQRLLFLLDLHYSDTWADPGHQKKPAAWDRLPFPQLVAQVRDYSRAVLRHLRENGAMPDAVQIGNETRNGLLYGSGTDGAGPQPGGGFWEKTPGGRDRAVQLLAAGLTGVREGAAPAPAPRTILHIPDGQDPAFVQNYFQNLTASAKAQNIALDFDMVGLSYYPADPWDKKQGYPGWTLARLSASMAWIATTLHKPVLVVETSWPQAGTRAPVPGAPAFPFTPDGQAAYYRALIAAVHAVPGGLGRGVVAWEQDALNWNSVFDARGVALPAVRVLGRRSP